MIEVIAPSYTVSITNNETGETRNTKMNIPWHESSLFWWTEGNFSCDCNRYDVFHDRENDRCMDDIVCSDHVFTVNYATVNGEKILIDGEK